MSNVDPYTICFDASGYFCLSQIVYRGYQDNWNTFNRIQSFNINVSTQRAQGRQDIYYYAYTDYKERNAFTNGRMLHIRRYPNSNWDPVPENY